MRAEHRVARTSLITLVTLASLLAGCATRHAPPEWLPYAQEASRQAWGGWIQLQVGEGASAQSAVGELLAVSPESLLTLRDSTVSAFPLRSVTRATLEVYDPQSDKLGQITLAGTIGTLTHGYWLIFTAPLWLIVGGSSTAVLSRGGLIEYSAADSAKGRRVLTWKDLSLHARFPQGMPPGLDRTALHERPRRGPAQSKKPWPGSITTP